MFSVMIVEDEENVRTSLKSYFEDLNYIVFEAENGEEAIEILKCNPIKAVIVDVRLPGMDGIEFVKKAVNINDKTVFIFHTGSPEFVYPENLKGHKRVSKDVFYKPVLNLSELNDTIVSMTKDSK